MKSWLLSALIAVVFGGIARAGTVYYEAGTLEPFCSSIYPDCVETFSYIGASAVFVEPPFRPGFVEGPGKFKYELRFAKDPGIEIQYQQLEVWNWGLEYGPGGFNYIEQRLFSGPDPSFHEAALGYTGFFSLDAPYDVTSADGLSRTFGSYYGGPTFLVIVGGNVTPRPYQFFITAIPEPSTWWSLLIGFGIAGTVLRRRFAQAIDA